MSLIKIKPLANSVVILKRIAELEASITARRLREATLGDTTFIAGVDAEIATLRSQLGD